MLYSHVLPAVILIIVLHHLVYASVHGAHVDAIMYAMYVVPVAVGEVHDVVDARAVLCIPLSGLAVVEPDKGKFIVATWNCNQRLLRDFDKIAKTLVNNHPKRTVFMIQEAIYWRNCKLRKIEGHVYIYIYKYIE